MDIAFYIGASCTDDEMLFGILRRQAETLAEGGICVPDPSSYRKLIRDALVSVQRGAALPEAGEIILDAITHGDHPRRLVLGNPNFLAIPSRIFAEGAFYGQAALKIAALAKLFPDNQISLYMGIRSGVGHLNEAFRRSDTQSLSQFMNSVHPLDISWFDLVQRIRRAAPQMELTVWCNEDVPVISPHILMSLADEWQNTFFARSLIPLSDLLDTEGVAAAQAVLLEENSPSIAKDEQIRLAALETFGKYGALTDTITLPEVSPKIINEMQDIYEEDCAAIAALEDVTFLRPLTA